MNLAFTMQKFQDWFTQQWVIIWGRKINLNESSWLLGPFGELNGIGDVFIEQIAKKENLLIQRNCKQSGLLPSISLLNINDNKLKKLPKSVIDFYENTSEYKMLFHVKWNPFFRVFGYFINRLFSQRINQLNIPISNLKNYEKIESEIIQLQDPTSKEVKYTIWLRKFISTGNVIYSGIYGTCKIPSGKTCVKTIFPLPKGNATVILKPSIGNNNELILDSSGKRFGDAGFYFIVNDSQNILWSQFISSFTDKLIVSEKNEVLIATQTLKLWNLKVATFNYELVK